jgi:hypothetical protein
MRDTIDMAREVKATAYTNRHYPDRTTYTFGPEQLKAFEALVRADEREQIEDEWSMCVQSDLEHGVKLLNEQAAKDWFKNYPEIAKFGAWLAARGNT